MFGAQKSHCEQDEFAVYHFFFPVEAHDWAPSLRIRFPYDSLDFGSYDVTVSPDEAIGVQEPPTDTTLFVA